MLVPSMSVEIPDMIRRMFVSTWSLGSTGLRVAAGGQAKGEYLSEGRGVTTHLSRLHTKKTRSVLGGDVLDEVPTMNGNVVHVIPLHDLCSSYAYRWYGYIDYFV